jgi:MarR family transcriptional regulator, negative regulator of the multidrug operon emrRAB
MARLTDCIEMMDAGIERVTHIIPSLPATEATLARLMLMVGSGVEQELESNLKPHKLNHSEFLTLMILYSRPDGSSTPGELCEFTSQGATNMTRIGNALVKRGLITRAAAAQDRRSVSIRITPAGRRFMQKVLPPLFPRLDAMFTGFSATDRRHLNRLLRKLAQHLDQLSHPTP